jgi:hypothetical protein
MIVGNDAKQHSSIKRDTTLPIHAELPHRRSSSTGTSVPNHSLHRREDYSSPPWSDAVQRATPSDNIAELSDSDETLAHDRVAQTRTEYTVPQQPYALHGWNGRRQRDGLSIKRDSIRAAEDHNTNPHLAGSSHFVKQARNIPKEELSRWARVRLDEDDPLLLKHLRDVYDQTNVEHSRRMGTNYHAAGLYSGREIIQEEEEEEEEEEKEEEEIEKSKKEEEVEEEGDDDEVTYNATGDQEAQGWPRARLSQSVKQFISRLVKRTSGSKKQDELWDLMVSDIIPILARL